MKPLNKLALHFFRSNKLIVASSIFSIMISVCLIITVFVFSANAKQTIKDDVKQLYGNMDLSVGYNPGQNKVLDEQLASKIASQPDVKEVSDVLITHLTVDAVGAKIYTIGVENDDLVKSRYKFHKNFKKDEVSMNASLAEALQIDKGKQVIIEGESFKLVETLKDIKAGGTTPDLLIMSKESVQQFVFEKTKKMHEATYMLIKGEDGADVLKMAAAIKRFDKELRIDIAEENEYLKMNLESLKVFLIVISVLVVIVTSLLIVSNFDVLLYKSKNQLAVMRSIGATNKQLKHMIMIQSSTINMIGVTSGLMLAIICNTYLQGMLERIFSIQITVMDFYFSQSIFVAFGCGLLIQIFLFLPSNKVAKTLPLQTMIENEKMDFKNSKVRKKVGFILLIIGFSIVLFAVGKDKFGSGKDTEMMYVSSALLILIAFFTLLPLYMTAWLIRFLPISKKLFGHVSYVAIKNLIPQVKKNTLVILTISTMMIIAVFGTVLITTISHNEIAYVKSKYPTPIVIESRTSDEIAVRDQEALLTDQKEAVKKITSVDGISRMSGLGSLEVKTANGNETALYRMGDLVDLEKQGIIPHLPEQLENKAVVSEKFAKKHHIQVGTTLEVGNFYVSKQAIEYEGFITVGAIIKETMDTDIFMSWQNNTFLIPVDSMFISTNAVDETLLLLKDVQRQFPELKISNLEDSLEQSSEMLKQRWAIFIIVIGVILLCVMFGVFNTLANNINSKRKEFAILRVISLSKIGVMKVILTQVLLYLIIGLFVGILAGIIFTAIILLIDPGKIYINYNVIFAICITMLLGGLIVFTPIASNIAKMKLSDELLQDK
ncbi:FtsX-like permease family protein [Bacillus massiliigorillae]|uniref:FtsX-like permease family protein n=1 Tax=Bacillus massiliigorillae TaxID=1243664 RepID=UPI0003A87BBD|nr:FtsX-like permease family protein [Bacillus massiliigorillae]